MITPYLSIFDFQNVIAYFKKPIEVVEGRSFDDYTIIVPVFNKIEYLKNLEFLTKYRDKVIITTTKNPAPEMKEALDLLLAQGFRINYVDLISETGSTEIKTYNTLLKKAIDRGGKEKLLKESVRGASSRYTCFLDGDSVPEMDIGRLCATMEKYDLEIASVNIIPNSRKGFLEKMQYIEYSIAMRTRNFRPWLTSGACVVARTEVMNEIMNTHSLYFAGGDVEIGILSRMMKKKSGHINFNVFTEVPDTFRAWFKQRRNWWCGTFRLNIINADRSISSPLYFFYITVLATILLPLKWESLFREDWYALPLMWSIYIPANILINWPVKNAYMLVYPLYSAFQSFVMPWFGLARYLRLLKNYKIVGRIKIRK